MYRVSFDVLSLDAYAKNPPDRCYLCKKALFTRLLAIAQKQGCNVLTEGSNMDDMGDYRPGMRAIAELGVKSPLREAGLTKAEIRLLSEQLKLPTWNKPSFACLATRFVYGESITEAKIRMVDQGEQFLYELGIHQFRVRIHGENMARIEVPREELEIVMQHREQITEAFRKIGFLYVTLDLDGYRTGSMNETLKI